MQKTILFILIIIIFSNTGISQITKRNWLVGGTGSFSSQFEKTNSFNAHGLHINISPDIGFFVVDKFAIGATPSYAYDKLTYRGGVSRSHQLSIGPFLRYYFLKPEKIINIFSAFAYQYAIFSTNVGGNDSQNTFTFSAGTVAYFNSSVGIELTANYQIFNQPRAITSANTFILGIGFQIHLQKEKN